MKILSLLCLCCLGLAAEDQVQFQPGVLAKVYACGAFSGKLWWQEYKDTSNLWPIDKLPDSPGEILRLKELPIVDATPLPQLAKDGIPSYLVNPKTGILRGVNFYAVEFEGYFSAPIEGVYTLVITSDDPIEVFIEGKSVCKSDYAADPIYGPTLTGQDRGGNPNGSVVAVDQGADPRLKAYSATIQASLRLAPNKWLSCRSADRLTG